MSLSTIISKCSTEMAEVSGMGKVYGYERWAAPWTTFLSLFKTTGNKINGWTISRVAAPQRQETLGEKERAHILLFRGVYGLDDSANTEATFQTQIESMVTKFNEDDNENLGGACLTTHPDWGPMSGLVGLQVDKVENRMFGTVLCHYAECRLCAIETVLC